MTNHCADVGKMVCRDPDFYPDFASGSRHFVAIRVAIRTGETCK